MITVDGLQDGNILGIKDVTCHGLELMVTKSGQYWN